MVEHRDLGLGGVGSVVRVAAGALQRVAQPVEAGLVAVAQPIHGLVLLPVFGHLVEPLERRVRQPHARLDLLAAAFVALAQAQPPDQRRQGEARQDQGDQHRAVGEEDHEVALRERVERDRQRRGERDLAAHAARGEHDALAAVRV